MFEILAGRKLRHMMRKNSMNINQLASLTHQQPSQILAIIEGAARITPRLSVELETIYFGVSEDWVKSENIVDVQRIKTKDERFPNV